MKRWESPRGTDTGQSRDRHGQSGETEQARELRFKLFCKGADTRRHTALPEDEGLGEREREGLGSENAKPWGTTIATESAIKSRFFGGIAGRKDR